MSAHNERLKEWFRQKRQQTLAGPWRPYHLEGGDDWARLLVNDTVLCLVWLDESKGDWHWEIQPYMEDGGPFMTKEDAQSDADLNLNRIGYVLLDSFEWEKDPTVTRAERLKGRSV